jgi:hypothetical protein
MKGIRFRWVLPIFHLAMDLILVAILINTLRHAKPAIAEDANRQFVPVSYSQPRELIDFRGPGLLEPFLLLTTGTLPVTIVSLLALAAANGLDIPYEAGSVLWLGLYEALAMPLWFFIDDSGRRWGLVSICVRLAAGMVASSSIWGLGVGLQLLFWLVAFAAGIWFLGRRIRSRLS